MVDCWVIHHPPLDFHGAGGRGRRPWLCKHAPWSRTGADGPQAEERAMAADAHRIAHFDEFLFFVFLRGSEEKTNLELCGFLFFSIRERAREREQHSKDSYLILWQGENMTRAKNCHHTTLHSVLSNKYNTHSKDSR